MSTVTREYQPQLNSEGAAPELQDDSVVVSGMSGLFPSSGSVKDFSKILYQKVNPVTSDSNRWTEKHHEVPEYVGKVPGLDRFDAQFFMVHHRLGIAMDPMARKVLEQAYQAIYDAGLSPKDINGKNVGVFIGAAFSIMENKGAYDCNEKTGYSITGCSKTMYANRISYWLNAKGPSVTIDDACCGSMVALEQAMSAIRRGVCEAAIVGGTNLCIEPHSQMHYNRCIKLSPDGKTRSFDEHANGCVKSEAVSVLFLQKAKHALRAYAEIIHVKNEFTSKLSGETGQVFGFIRNPNSTAELMKQFYIEAGVSPQEVKYVEACGSATPEADEAELQAIEKVFCENRTDPLLVGSVISNVGFTDAASGVTAITKVLLGYHHGLIAGNLHCDTPRQDIPAIRDGRMNIVMKHQPIRGSYAAVNCLSITGVNSHLLLRGYRKAKDLTLYKTSIPRLVTLSARQKEHLKDIFEDLKLRPIDAEELALLHNIHSNNIHGHLGRGYIILDTDDQQDTISLSEKMDHSEGTHRPLWFVYSGMGSQWAGMGAQLMRIPIFAAAIERCRNVLKPKGIDIVHIITSQDKTIFDNVLNSFVGIAAIQIGLTDILTALGLFPETIIGHSVGELGCAYVDGCLTAEEMILSAYSRGKASNDTPLIRGAMAAVGLGYEQISKLCPPKIEVACHNSSCSSTISGPEKNIREFVARLTADGVFAKEVPAGNVAYHSSYIADAGPSLLQLLSDIIHEPRARSERWLSTSVPQERWNEPIAKYCSPEYLTNNLLSPVYFEEISTLIPTNAVLIEIAPHGLLQAILKQSLPRSCTSIPLTQRGHRDSAVFLLEAIGKLYVEGYSPLVSAIYPTVEFPVSTRTPHLAQFVKWYHTETWPLPLFEIANKKTAASSTFVLSIYNDESSYLKGHNINGKTLVPFAYALVCAWDTLAMFLNVEKRSLDVEFRDVQLFAQPVLANQQTVRLQVSLHRGTGWFEIMDNDYKVATGFISSMDVPTMDNFSEDLVNCSNEVCNLNSADIYGLFYERRYDYSGEFRSIYSANESLSEANVLWNDNWVTFIDGLIQLNTLKYTQYDAISQPDRIRKMIIDVKEHCKSINSNLNADIKTAKTLQAQFYDLYKRTRCGGVLVEDIRFHNLIKMNADRVSLQKLAFVPRVYSKFDFSTSLSVIFQIVAENTLNNEINVVGLALENGNHILEEIQNIAKNGCTPGIKVNFQQIDTVENFTSTKNVYDGVDLILVQKLSKETEIVRSFQRIIKNNTFIVNEENVTTEPNHTHPSSSYSVVSVLKNAVTKLVLARWTPTPPTATVMSTFTVHSISDLPVLIDTRNNLDFQSDLVILTFYPPVPGLLNLVKQWRRDSVRNRVHIIMVNENTKNTLPSLNELDDVNMLAYNIIEDGLWGGKYYLPLEETSEPVADEKIKLQSDIVGNVDSLRWVHADEPTGTGNLITVHYAGVNVGDVERALGVIQRHDKYSNGYGMEFSGLSESGERVMGLVPNGAASSHVMALPELTWPVPSYWSLEDAATIPFAYVCAYYCLVIKSTFRVKSKNLKQYSILVHGGAGALGQAVISIALSMGYRVFSTVGDVPKKRFLLKMFPELNAEDIGNSRDATFGDLILSATNGMGCNKVICCLKGQLKNTTIRCCAPFGITLDTVQILYNEGSNFGMSHLTDERSYAAVDISSIFANPKSEEMQKIHSMISEGISLGHVRPLSRVTFAPHEAPRAFRLLAASRHRGRVLLRTRDSISPRQRRYSPEEPGCHIIICDKQSIGLQLVNKIIDQGVKKLHLHFVSTPRCFDFKKSLWEKLQVQLTTSVGELNDTNDINKLLQNATNILGPIEGIYVTARSVIKLNAFNDNSVATLCSSLKKFLIVQYDDNCENDNFFQNKFPITYLDVSMLETRQDSNEVTWYRDVTEAIERALQSPDSDLLAQPKHPSYISLAHQIGTLADLNITDKTSSKATLEELGLTPEKSAVVSAFLRDVHNTYLEEKDIFFLTMKKLKQIEDRNTDMHFEEVNGLEMFYSHLDPDELMSTLEMVFLPTLVTNSTMRNYDRPSETSLFIIPGLEGQHARFRTLCEHLKLPAFVLQPGLDHPDETPQELALRYYKILLKKLNFEKSFYLMGYEIGVIVALELAAILEDQGKTGTVFCIGDGPDEMKAVLSAEMATYGSECALQEGVVRHMFGLMARGSAAPLERALRGCSSWRARVDACVRTLLGRVSHSAQYARALVEAAYARIGTARRYSAAPRALRSRLVLLRARRHRAPASTAGDECSLQRYSQRALVVRDLAAPMPHAAADLRAPAIINAYLDEHVLQESDGKNLYCVSKTNNLI